MSIDFSFDERVAQRYTAQRKHPPQVSRQIGQAIAEVVGGNGLVLEVGVGNGRIAIPACQSGLQVIGLDISANMLAEVEASQPRLFLMQGDMHALPLRDDAVNAILTVHVLHLTTDWQQVLSEAIRVLRPDGFFIQGEDWVDPQSVFGLLRDCLRQKAVELYPQLMPPAAGVSKQHALSALGGNHVTELTVAEWTTWLSPEERLSAIENRMDNESWFLPEPIFNQLLPELKKFAAETWSDLSEKLPVKRRFLLKVTSGDW